MKISPFRECLFAAGLAVSALVSHAQIVTLRATINGAQETPPTASAATGNAIMLYNVADGTFDFVVTLNNFTNTLANSHIHEAAVGVPGGVVNPFGAESVYVRTGNTLTATFHGTYAGNKTTLLTGGSYYNAHTAQYPGGEIRGQLIPDKKRLVANISQAQEQAANPSATINSKAWGAAVMLYDPMANRVSLRVSLFNFTNTLANSHYHEAPPGTNGSVVTPLGAASVYTSGGGGWYTGNFDIPYTGDPVKLLTGGAYLNFHSNVYPGGEIRGQVTSSDEIPGSRLINVSTLGYVGTGALIQGFVVQGPDPVRVLVTAKGPSLTALGVTGALSDPWLTLYDSKGNAIANNNDIGTPAAGSEMASLPGVPTNTVESAIVAVLSPGNYSVVVSGNNGATGLTLIEVNDLRTASPTFTANSNVAAARARASKLAPANAAPQVSSAPEASLATITR